MSLIELLVAMLVFTVFMTAAVLSFQSTLAATTGNRGRTVGASLVAQELDAVSAMPFAGVPALDGHSSTEVVGPTTYTTTEAVKEVLPPGVPTDACAFAGSGTDGRAVVVNVSVSWKGQVGSAETGQIELSPPATAISAQYATLSLQVAGANGLPLANAELSINTQPSRLAYTDKNGCASFASLQPNVAYTVTGVGLVAPGTTNLTGQLLIDQGQLEQGSNPPVAQWTSLTLASGSYLSQQLVFDVPATLSSTVSVPSGYSTAYSCQTTPTQNPGSCPGATANGLTINLITTAIVGGNPPDVVGGVTGTKLVFPFTTGWESYAGDCTDAAVSNGLSNTSAPVATAPGATAMVAAPAVGVIVTVANSSPLANYQGFGYGVIVAFHAKDSSCPSEFLAWRETVGATGQFKLAVPAGKWSFARAPQDVQNPSQSLTLVLPGPPTSGLLP